MNRPCWCHRCGPEPGNRFGPKPCQACRLHSEDQEYRTHWGGGLLPSRRKRPCRHLGVETGEKRQCASCGGKVEIKLLACGKHGVCTTHKPLPGVACCAGNGGCPDYATSDTYGGHLVRNLLMHIYPVAQTGIWQRNVAQVLRRIRLFNGRRVVAIVTDGRTDPAEHVKDAFAGHVHEFIELPNNLHLREVVSFVPLWLRVQTDDPAQITFYCQAKGVTRPVNPGVTVHPWTELMYETCLDYPDLVEEALQTHALAGSFLKVGRGFEGSASEFHFSGAFFWGRNAEVFRRDWRRIDQQWWGAEAWPGLLCKPDEAACLFHRGHCPTLDLYSMDYLTKTVRPEYEAWKRQHTAARKEWR